ncbi:MAG: YfhO family protein [Anaerolineaceae bacterium]|nr:YfhO family protein [Anaerolineaceae bacterium]
MGAPLLANYQLAIFYPPSWILYPFYIAGGTPWMAWANTLLIILHLFWAGIGLSLILKRLNISVLGQTIGGVSFALCGYLVARAGFFSIIWTAAWLPWILLTASQISSPTIIEEKQKPIIPFLLVIFIGLQLLAGHAQTSWYTLMLASAWVFIGGWTHGGFRLAIFALLRLAGAYILAGIFASIQLFPTAEYLVQSQRSAAVDYQTAMTYSFWPWRLLNLIAPDLFGNPAYGNYWGYASYWEDAIYIGVLPFILAASTLAVLPGKPRREHTTSPHIHLIRFLWVLIAVAILLALGNNTPVFPFLYHHVPTFDMFQAPARYMIWLEFALCLLAGIGSDRWRTPTGRGLYWLRLATMGGFAVTVGAFLAWHFLGNIHSTFIAATALAGLWGLGAGLLTLFIPPVERTAWRAFWAVLVVVWVAADLLVADFGLNPSVDIKFYDNDVQNIGVVRSQLGDQRIYIDSSSEYWLKFSRFLRFENFNPIEDWTHLRFVMLPDLNLLAKVNSANNFDPLIPGRFSTWMKTLETLSPVEQEEWYKLMNVGMLEMIDVYKTIGVTFNPVQSLDRVRWVPCAISAKDETDAMNKLKALTSTTGDQNINNSVILEGSNLQSPGSCLAASAQVRVVSQDSVSIRIATESKQSGWIVVSDVWYPGWKAYLDQKVVPIWHANYLFRAVFVPAGEHEIDFDYQPLSFLIGTILSLISIIVIILIIGLNGMRKYQARAKILDIL